MVVGKTKSWDDIDYFCDESILADPHQYFDHLRAKGPVVRLPNRPDVVVVTGYDEGVAVFRDENHFSSAISPNGPIPPLPFRPSGDDITDQIEAHRHLIPGADNLATLDPPAHTKLRVLLNGMITPKRMADRDAAMTDLAEARIETFARRGSVEILSEYAHPFATNVIADLVGVPQDDYVHVDVDRPSRPGLLGVGSAGVPNNPYEKVMCYFREQINLRRREQRDDVMGRLATARYADGTLAPVEDVVMVVVQVFGAGLDTTTRVIAAALRSLAESKTLQEKLRAEREAIPSFIEEVLRLHGTVRSDFRLVKKDTKVGELQVSAGTIAMLAISAMNRDARRFDDPHVLRLGRPNIRDHISFGRGIHSCVGAPLARAELRITVDRFLERMAEFSISDAHHGSKEMRRFDFVPSYLLQGLEKLHLVFSQSR